MYSAGYDPTGAVSIFEKLEALQKTQPGKVARVLATHPMDVRPHQQDRGGDPAHSAGEDGIRGDDLGISRRPRAVDHPR